MKIRFLFFLFIIVPGLNYQINAQSHFPAYYEISFKDKNQSIYSLQHPEAFLSSASIARKSKYLIDIDQFDFPVNSWYLDSLISKNAKVKYASRWMNSALLEIADSMILEEIMKFSFVSGSKYLGPLLILKNEKTIIQETEDEKLVIKKQIQSGFAFQQLEKIGIRPMHELGFKGDGVMFAIFDAGFAGVDKMEAFEKLFQNNRILASYDFVKQKTDVFADNTHGTSCFSTIAGNLPGKYLGSAPDALFYLFRTEFAVTEYPVEEYYWLIAAETADSIGVQVISSSLGYNMFDDSSLNYSQQQLDGKTSLISKAAKMATEKGMLLINSAGNDGQNSWRKISFPADVKDVITVGAIDQEGDYANFSSVGNTADGRIKPDLVCVGQNTVLINTQDEIFKGNGTSFAAPTLAGGVALLVQSCPSSSPSEIRNALLKTASHYNSPDSITGFGVPNIFLAYLYLNGQKIPELGSEEAFQILPNPFEDEIFVYFSSSSAKSLDCNIYNLNGKKVRAFKNLNPVIGNNIFCLSGLHSLKAGVYMITLSDDEKIYTRKIVKAE